MVDTWMISLGIFVATVIFGAGIYFLKINVIAKDIKSIQENDLKSININIKSIQDNLKDSEKLHDKLVSSHKVMISVYVEAFMSLISVLFKSNMINKSDLLTITTKMNVDSVNKTLQEIKGGTGNPISKEEAMRLQKYVEMARRNDVFSPEEAQDFYNLGELITQERSDDKGAWGILMLAAIVLALYFLVKK